MRHPMIAPIIDIVEDGRMLDQCSAETRKQILEGYETEPPYKEDLQSLALRRGLLLKDTPPKVVLCPEFPSPL